MSTCCASSPFSFTDLTVVGSHQEGLKVPEGSGVLQWPMHADVQAYVLIKTVSVLRVATTGAVMDACCAPTSLVVTVSTMNTAV